MQKATVAVQKAPITWIVVVDGKQGQIYLRKGIERRIPLGGNGRHAHYDERHALELVSILGAPLKAEPVTDYAFSNKQAGRVFDSAGTGRHIAEPRLDARDEVKCHFMKEVAHTLAEGNKQRAFDRLVLVAPPKMLGELRECLEPAVKDKVAAELPKDLTHYGNSELAAHLEGVGYCPSLPI